MISPAWVRAMAAYNAEMNRRLYTAADGLDDAARRTQAGAFFGSIQGTLNHLLWGDAMWMHRFDGWEKPAVSIADSPRFLADWPAMRATRTEYDSRIEAWAARLGEADLTGDVAWFSGAAGHEMTRPRWLLLSHMFNHQTHHRGQAHALLTRAGAATGATDLPWVIPAEAWG